MSDRTIVRLRVDTKGSDGQAVNLDRKQGIVGLRGMAVAAAMDALLNAIARDPLAGVWAVGVPTPLLRPDDEPESPLVPDGLPPGAQP